MAEMDARRRLLWIAYLVLVHLALLVEVLPRPPRPSDFIPVLRELHRQMDPSVPKGATVFLGDSLTMALPVSAVAALSVNYGIGGQRSDELIESMDIYRSLASAKAVVVMIGTNDLMQGREEGIESRYRAILAKIPPGAAVFMASPPPLRYSRVSDRQKGRSVMQAAKVACEAPRCRFVDAYSALADADGMPAPGVLLPDGIHLAPAGYATLITALRDALPAASPPNRMD